MKDYILLEKIWQDDDFFELQITCSSEFVVASTNTYSTDASIDDLANKLQSFLNGEVTECLWENGKKGDDSTASVSFRFIMVDKLGHCKIEVYMEIDDGGKFSSHHCCFFVNTELGLLDEFQKGVSKLKEPILGKKIMLNQLH